MPYTRKQLWGLSPVMVDSIFAAGLTVAAWVQALSWAYFVRTMTLPGGPPEGFFPGRMRHVESLTWYGAALIALSFLPLALRRRYPLWVLAIVTLASGTYDKLHRLPPIWTFVGVLFAMYTVARMKPLRWTIGAALAAIAVSLFTSLPPFGDVRWYAELGRVISMIGAAVAFGIASRNQERYLEEAEQRAAEAERTREEEARRRVDEERLRIARELHDVTAHSLSIIAVQSGAAERVIGKDPDAASRALESIRTTSKNALDELRAMLGVLRGAEEAAPVDPSPKLERLGDLVTAVSDAGVAVRTHVGEIGELSAVVDSSAYRVVQESLTNVVRHAHAKHADVSIEVIGDALELAIVDDGVGGAPTGGHGIAGMRERVHALGGTFEAGPVATGGFRVAASIPVARRNA